MLFSRRSRLWHTGRVSHPSVQLSEEKGGLAQPSSCHTHLLPNQIVVSRYFMSHENFRLRLGTAPLAERFSWCTKTSSERFGCADSRKNMECIPRGRFLVMWRSCCNICRIIRSCINFCFSSPCRFPKECCHYFESSWKGFC